MRLRRGAWALSTVFVTFESLKQIGQKPTVLITKLANGFKHL